MVSAAVVLSVPPPVLAGDVFIGPSPLSLVRPSVRQAPRVERGGGRVSVEAGGPASACRVQKQTAVREEVLGAGFWLEKGSRLGRCRGSN